MSWTIANAKQQFSEVLRLCVEEPQPVFNRSRHVAVVVSARDYAAFDAWRQQQQSPAALDVAGLFGPAREALRDAGDDALDMPPRVNRPQVEFDPESEPGEVHAAQ
ncbi:MAG: type II toxin-antitoxin system prevent-host-death family antitoxin [Betaproteobacteria bacterium]|jgi:prevent-host-death family protein